MPKKSKKEKDEEYIKQNKKAIRSLMKKGIKSATKKQIQQEANLLKNKPKKKKKALEEAEPPKRLVPLSRLGQPATPRKLRLSRPKTPPTPRRKKPMQMVSENIPYLDTGERPTQPFLIKKLNRERYLIRENERMIKGWKKRLIVAEMEDDEENIEIAKMFIDNLNADLIVNNERFKQIKDKLK